MDCDVVYALDVAGDTPRIVGASEMQSRLDSLVAAGAPDCTTSVAAHRKALRGRVVAETGALACSHGGTMVFRQRGVDGRKPHFAHLALRSSSSEHAPGETSACACGGRGGRGHAHIQAQKLIVDYIASIEFKHWCPKRLHQLVVRKNAGFTATVEQSARNAGDRNVRLDVAVHKDGVFAFAVEVTHTHRVSPASRRGIPYVDVNASETVRRLQAGETTLLCESASGVPPCVACLTEDIKVKLKKFKALMGRAQWNWKCKIQEAFDKLSAEKRDRRDWGKPGPRWRTNAEIEGMCLLKAEARWERKGKMLLRHAFQKLKGVKQKQRREQEAQEKAERRRIVMKFEIEMAAAEKQAHEKQKQIVREFEQRRSEVKKQRARTFWGAFMQRSGAAQGGASEKTSAAPKRQRVWESDEKRAKRHREEHWEKMNGGEAATSNAAGSAGSTASTVSTAPELRPKKVCPLCKNARKILVNPNPGVNGGYGYVKQCHVCRDKCVREGWGTFATFNPEEDALICKLLNAHGEPMFEGYAVSRMHFYKSVLAFHDAFWHKQWEALVDHIRANFTTTMSAPNANMPGYRGWYRKKNNKPETRLEAGQLSI